MFTVGKKQENPEERKAQFQAFVEASRELECDEDPEAFKGIVRKVTASTQRPKQESAED